MASTANAPLTTGVAALVPENVDGVLLGLHGSGVVEPAIDLEGDLLAIADTKLVLGNWYAECVMNGRSLPDFAGILGMCTVNYGHTRAIYQHLARHGHDYAGLERGRGPEEIHSMDLLDAAPTGWEDFIATIWFAELAAWQLISGYLGHTDRAIAGIARKVGQEAYFHLKYAQGWMHIIGEDADERARFIDALAARYPRALQWFGPHAADDPVFDAGERDMPLQDIRAAFVGEAGKVGEYLGGPSPEMPAAGAMPEDWRSDARRCGPLPAGLFEVVRFKDAELAH